jgi:hypothetical protein
MGSADLSTDRKGAIAESAVLHAAVRLGLLVALPYSPQRYDLILDLGARLLRVQCKWAMRRGDVVVVRCYTSRRSRQRIVRRGYDCAEIDAIAAYCADLGRCYLISMSSLRGQRNVHLRIAPAANGQNRGIRWATQYDFETIDWEALARLGP